MMSIYPVIHIFFGMLMALPLPLKLGLFLLNGFMIPLRLAIVEPLEVEQIVEVRVEKSDVGEVTIPTQ